MEEKKDNFTRFISPDRDEAIKAVSFPVERIRTNFTFGGKTFDSERDLIVRPDVVKENGPAKIGYVSPDYKFVPHADALQVAFEAIEKSGLPFSLSSLSLDRDGAKMYASFKSEQSFEITPGNQGDSLKPILTLVNSYDGGNKLGFDLESERLVCLNLARAVAKDLQLRFMHTLSADVAALLKGAQAGIAGFENKIVPFYKELAKVEITKEEAIKTVAVAVKHDAIPKNVASFAKHCVDSDRAAAEGVKRTMWAAFNAFTWASTRRAEQGLSPTREREIRGKIGALFADGGRKLLDEARQMSEANAAELLKVVA